jgi:TPR repeat protein
MNYQTEFKILAASLCLAFPLGAQQPTPANTTTKPVPSYFRADHERAVKGDVEAMLEENKKYQEAGLPKPHADQTVVSKLEKLAKAGDIRAQRRMLLFREESGLDPLPRPPEREAQIRSLTKRLADSGDPEGMVAWSMVLQGDGRSKKDWNEQEISHWFYKSWDYYEAKAKQGDVKAMVTLVETLAPAIPSLMASDIGNRRMYWREQAALHGDPASMFVMGMEFWGKANPKTGLSPECEAWFLKSAKAGYWRAMLTLAGAYAHGSFQILNGEAPRPNPAKAWEWVDRAVAVTGNPQIWKAFVNEDDEDFMEGFPPRPGSK